MRRRSACPSLQVSSALKDRTPKKQTASRFSQLWMSTAPIFFRTQARTSSSCKATTSAAQCAFCCRGGQRSSLMERLSGGTVKARRCMPLASYRLRIPIPASPMVAAQHSCCRAQTNPSHPAMSACSWSVRPQLTQTGRTSAAMRLPTACSTP